MTDHTNRLINETSPYLLQHAHNPVDWYPWGEEALQRAKIEDKPILVSIGYAACHWCHVMERESFENEDTARMMNDFFINIKIDREERPDIDHIYMDAVQAMTGSGGWPLNVFLTPDCKPFYGGTYFPPVRAFNRASWRETISSIHQAYKERKNEILEQADNLTGHIAQSNAFGLNTDTDEELDKNAKNTIVENILKVSDKNWGGFGQAPKFPQTFIIQFLLRDYYFNKNDQSLKQALLSLDKMIYGGLFDQLGGGFARYSTDQKWLAPHFEKMLYDNALLISVISEAYQLTRKERYKTVIRHTVDFIKRELWSDEGGFYSALDADSEGVEGKFYTWNKAEIDSILGEKSGLFCRYYNVSDEGNWEHTNILWVPTEPVEFATLENMELDELEVQLEEARQKLLHYRASRVRPLLDDKVLLGWNALMNTALSKAHAATGFDDLKKLAVKNIAFLEKQFGGGPAGEWFHTYKNGNAKYPAFLDDYAALVQAYIHLQEITGDTEHLTKAKAITDFIFANFEEEQSGFFYFTHQFQQDVIVRKKEVFDGATPSGNSLMATNLHYLSVVYNRNDWYDRAVKLTKALQETIVKYPTSFGYWCVHLQQLLHGLNEIVVAGKEAPSELPEVLSHYIPNRVLQSTVSANTEFPLLEGKEVADETRFFLCKNYACQQPVNSIEALIKNLN